MTKLFLVKKGSVYRETVQSEFEDGEYCADIKSLSKATKAEARRVAQNRLMWAWLTDMQNTSVESLAGNDKDWWHEDMKRRFLINILERDDHEFAEMLESLRVVYRSGMKDHADRFFKHVVSEASTTHLSVEQFSEYLKCIQRFCDDKCIFLRTDRYLMEMAIEQYR